MKKTLILCVVVIFAITLSSCASYTCPTYANTSTAVEAQL